MAWFKLNDSLNTLKDQLSNVSNVVQEAFQEQPAGDDTFDDEDDDHENRPQLLRRRLDTERIRSDELSALCGTQSQEVMALG